MKKNSFSDVKRLKLKNDFKTVFSLGKKLSSGAIALWYMTSEEICPCRLGVIVSKKLGKAVDRNRIKRILREIFRLNYYKIKEGTDIILYPKQRDPFLNFCDAEKIIISLWQKAGILQDD